MEPSPEISKTAGLTTSMSAVEFDTDTECFRATYDSTHDSPGLAVVEVVSTALGKDPLDLMPLQFVIETDALDELVTGPSNGLGICGSISFCYEGFDVTVYSEDIIEAAPTNNA